jgi:hypothetical protein
VFLTDLWGVDVVLPSSLAEGLDVVLGDRRPAHEVVLQRDDDLVHQRPCTVREFGRSLGVTESEHHLAGRPPRQ